MDGTRLEHVSEFKCLRCVLYESGADKAECGWVVGRWGVGGGLAGAMWSLFNVHGLQRQCARTLHETLSESVLT